jgi:diguanylate cyclase (GGDEF)-like protein
VAAFRDPLTGLPNLEQLRQFAEEQDQSATLPVPTALLYVDVNDLKEINTMHGRHVGDQVLREIVLQLTANLRAADVLFRLESDEFAILLLQTPRETATAIGSRIKTSIQQSATTRMPLNVSVTIVTAPDDGDRIESLIASARKRMRSRQSGSHSGSSSSHNPESIH